MDAKQAHEQYKLAGRVLLAAIQREFPVGSVQQFMMRSNQIYPSFGKVISHSSDGHCRIRLHTGTVKTVHFTQFE